MSLLPIVILGNDTWDNARRGVWCCPFCQYNSAGIQDNIWERNATKLVLEPRIWRWGQVAVFSECPKCFESSWLHYDAAMIAENAYEEFPPHWRITVSKLIKHPDWLDKHGGR